MKIEFNKVTWYSQLATIIVFTIIVPILSFYIYTQYQETFAILDVQVKNIDL